MELKVLHAFAYTHYFKYMVEIDVKKKFSSKRIKSNLKFLKMVFTLVYACVYRSFTIQLRQTILSILNTTCVSIYSARCDYNNF